MLAIRAQTFSTYYPVDYKFGRLLTSQYVHAIYTEARNYVAALVVVYAGRRTLHTRSQTWGCTTQVKLETSRTKYCTYIIFILIIIMISLL